MTQWKRALPCAALTTFAMLGVACLPGGGSSDSPTPTATRQDDVQAARTVTAPTSTVTPQPTELPVLPTLTTYTVVSGDYPTLIAEAAGVPADEQDAWIAEMLALNGVDAHSLQIGQTLILPPYGDGTTPTVNSNANEAPADPPAAVLEPVNTPPPATNTPQPNSSPASVGVPFAPTPPFVAFTTPTATPTATFTPTATPTATSTPLPTATPTIAPGMRAWLTSSEETAVYYYCDLDSGWQSIPGEKLLAFDSEQQLLAIWGRFRTKAPDSAC